jgi:hypothetical protein
MTSLSAARTFEWPGGRLRILMRINGNWSFSFIRLKNVNEKDMRTIKLYQYKLSDYGTDVDANLNFEGIRPECMVIIQRLFEPQSQSQLIASSLRTSTM